MRWLIPLRWCHGRGRLHFAAEALEAESWGRRLLIRLGPEQSALVSEWFRAFRQELTKPAAGA